MFNAIQSFIKITPLQKNFFFEPIKNFSPKIITLVVGIFSAMTALYCSYRAYQFYQKKASTKNSQNKPSSTSSTPSSSSSPSTKKVDLLSTQPTEIRLKISDFISAQEKGLLAQVNHNFKKLMDQDLVWKGAIPEKYFDKTLPLKSQVISYYSWKFTEQEIHAYAAFFQYKFSQEELDYIQKHKIYLTLDQWHDVIIQTKIKDDLLNYQDLLNDSKIKEKILIELNFLRQILNDPLNISPLIKDKFKLLRNKQTFSCVVPSKFSMEDPRLLEYLCRKRKCDKTIILSGNQVADILEKAFDRLMELVKEKK